MNKKELEVIVLKLKEQVELHHETILMHNDGLEKITLLLREQLEHDKANALSSSGRGGVQDE